MMKIKWNSIIALISKNTERWFVCSQISIVIGRPGLEGHCNVLPSIFVCRVSRINLQYDTYATKPAKKPKRSALLKIHPVDEQKKFGKKLGKKLRRLPEKRYVWNKQKTDNRKQITTLNARWIQYNCGFVGYNNFEYLETSWFEVMTLQNNNTFE